MEPRTVCRIDVTGVAPAQPSHGTGFLVAPDMVLTAAHVVEPFQADASKKLEVRFLDGTRHLPVDPIAGPVTVVSYDTFEDWALLSCPGAPRVRPMNLRQLDERRNFHWRTHGFPKDLQNEGLELRGKTLVVADRIQLASEIALGTPEGVSGAPLVVDGEVGAILSKSRAANLSETLFAIDIRVVARQCDAIRKLLPRHEPPYVPHVISKISGFKHLLRIPAEQLALDLSFGDEALPEPMARAMMRGGIPPTITVLEELVAGFLEPGQSAEAAGILTLSADAWIDGDAVEALWKVLSNPQEPNLVLLNAESTEIGNCYARRALSLKHNSVSKLPVSVNAPRGQPGAILTAFEKALLAALGYADVPQLRTKLLGRNKPVVVQVPPPVLTRAELDEIVTADPSYETVKFLMLVGPDAAAAAAVFPEARLIEPFHDLQLEADIPKNLTAARGRLEDALREARDS